MSESIILDSDGVVSLFCLLEQKRHLTSLMPGSTHVSCWLWSHVTKNVA